MNIHYIKDDILVDPSKTKHDFFCDIETLMYNFEQAETEKQVKYQKNITYSFACAYIFNGELYVSAFPSSKHFYDLVSKRLTNRLTGKVKKGMSVRLIFHNGNKYDNHFQQNDLVFFYGMNVQNMFIKQAISNNDTVQLKNLAEKMILEKRIKTKNNLEMNFKLNGITFSTCDTLIKTSSSLAMLGGKLFKAGLIKEENLKTDFDYSIFDYPLDMSDPEAHQYAQSCFHKLDDLQLTYIYNDVIILAFVYYYYSDIYPSFDFEKFSLTSNIAERFTSTDIAKFQMLNKVDVGENRDRHIKYTDYTIGDLNLYDFYKRSYNGGSNFYNQNFLNTIINEKIIGIDINHSYPYAMDYNLIPTFLVEGQSFDSMAEININYSDRYYYVYEVEKLYFNDEFLRKIKSDLVRRIIVKYLNNRYDYIYINTMTLKLINLFTDGHPFSKIICRKYTKHECVEFGNKEFLRENYYIKQIGGTDCELTFHGNPYEYTLDETKKNTHQLTSEEIDLAKTYNNGGYGFPALKPYFNLFRMSEDKEEYYNLNNGFKNTERNVLFSAFVTSVAFYNLLYPLHYLDPDVIDQKVYYGDTDSLYMSKQAFELLPKHLFDNYRLGAWGIDVVADKMIILNHKKYALQLEKRTKKAKHTIKGKEIKIVSGGIKKIEVFKTEVYESFEEFVSHAFSHGAVLNVDKTVMNYQGVLTFYKAKTKLEKGLIYADYFSSLITGKVDDMLKKIKKDVEELGTDDIIYFESPIGSFGLSEIYREDNPTEDKKDLSQLVGYIHFLRKML